MILELESHQKNYLFYLLNGRINESSSINTHGAGLGLLISDMLVKELGGDGIRLNQKLTKELVLVFNLKVD